MEAKLKKIIIKNFGAINNIEIDINGNITYLVGMNGSGKTTIGYTAIVAAFKGIVERGGAGQIIGERYRFIGSNGKSADVILHIEDVVNKATIELQNHITAGANGISFKVIEGPENYVIDQKWLFNLFNEALISAKKFSELTSQQQALALGINTKDHDTKIKAIKDEYTIINRELKSFGELAPVEKVESLVSFTELSKQKQEILNFNETQKNFQREYNHLIEEIEIKKIRIEELKKKLEVEERTYKLVLEAAQKVNKPLELKSTEEIDKQIANAETINANYYEYAKYVEKIEAKKKVEAKIEANRKALTTQEEERMTYIQKAKLPFKNLTIDDEGGLLLGGRPIRPPYYSTGELEKIVALIAQSQNPNLKLRFIDDFNLVDEENQMNILTKLTEAGFDVIVADVNKTSSKENSIIIRDGKVI